MKRFQVINEDNSEGFDSEWAKEAFENRTITTVNSISGGKTSAYIAKHYPADINLFALVRIEDKKNLWMRGRDEKTRQLVSDKLGMEFIGTAEMDLIIYTILDLEQHIGSEIKWVSGPNFEQVIDNHGGYLPNQMARFCTTDMKIIPMFDYLKANTALPVEMRIGFRPTELNRAKNVLERADETGLELFKTVIGKHKNGNNKWKEVPYRYVTFPLIEDNLQKDTIYNYWDNQKVRFAYRNNCVGCVNRQPLFLSHMVTKDKPKMQWFASQEERTGNTFNSKVSYKSIMEFGEQKSFFDEDFNDCDSGYCGV